MPKVRVLASFPPIQSAMKIGQDGMRAQLDIPESEMDRARALLDWRNQVFVVTFETEEDALRNGTHPSND
jgi:hypothetical protein